MDQQERNRKASIQIVLIFIGIQLLSGFIPLFIPEQFQTQGMLYSSMLLFIIGAIWMITIERKQKLLFSFEKSYKENTAAIWLWGILGIFFVFFIQIIASYIERQFFGVPIDSENTQRIIEIVRMYPWFLLSVGVFGPIMEEFVFRKALFGLLTEKIGGIGAAVISSLLFSLVHFDGHYLLYSSMALVFCWLYYKSRNIWTPIIAHCLMNTIVVLVNVYFV